ncbi:MAG: hypothetical protein ABW168_26735 [Sedimenticola sp.]
MAQSTPTAGAKRNKQLHSGGIHLALDAAGRPDAPSESSASITPIPNSNYQQIRTLDDLALTAQTLDQFPTVKAWREKLFDSEWIPEICDELPRLLTEFMRRPESQQLTPQTHRARALKHVFRHKLPPDEGERPAAEADGTK